MECPFCLDDSYPEAKEMDEDVGFDPVTDTAEISFECDECGAEFEGILKLIKKNNNNA